MKKDGSVFPQLKYFRRKNNNPKKWRVILFSGFAMLLFCVKVQSQQSWQQLVVPTVQQVKASFQQPPSEYANTVTWGWDGPMSREVIKRDLDSLHALGFRAVTIEAGYGMPAEYLSEGWFALVKTAVDEAKKRNMRVWIIDEGKYPSGFAGGLFSKKRPDLRMQALTIAERIPVSTGERINKNLPPQIMSAVAVNASDSSSQLIDVRSGAINWKAPEGNWQLLLVQHQFKTSVTRAANNPTRGKDTTNSLCDYLSPVAVKQFLEFTHEQYKKYIGNEFGKTVLGFRGDEPDFAYMPWTPTMLEEFRKRKGYNIQPYLASFFLKNLSEEQKKAKADYWDVWSDLFGENFFTQQANWCANNHLEYLVHLNHDDAMIALVKSEGDFYKDFRSVQIPGIDVIWDQIWPGKVADYPKFASSAAHLFGRPRALSESFAAFYTRPNVQQARWIVNQQLVRGINLFEFMFFPSTSNGKGGASSYMADKEFPSLMRYANRANYLLAMGRPAAQIAVYFPTTSLWLGHNASEKSTFDIAQRLLESQHDFDFMDEYSLTTSLLKNGNLINKSGQSYSTVIIPSIAVLSKAAFNRLQAFAKEGGKVIFMEDGPSLLTDKNFLNAGILHGKMNAVYELSEQDFLKDLPVSDFQLNEPCSAVKYNHRKWIDADVYFLFNESDKEVSRTITVNGRGGVQEWNANDGTIQNINGLSAEKGWVKLPIELKPYETKFIVVGG